MSENEAASAAQSESIPSVRAQLLATEHWSLLASRSTTQSEVLTRISSFLTLVSAGLVSLALVGQATRFSDAFQVFAVVVLGFVTIVGVLTELRVRNVAVEDLMYVLAMNRLRAAYTKLDPGIEGFFLSSAHDDMAGSRRTYDFFGQRTSFGQIAGSSMVFIAAVNAALVGLLAGGVASTVAMPLPLVVIISLVCGLAYLAASVEMGRRRYFGVWQTYTPYRPS
jgi:hypothetical protein